MTVGNGRTVLVAALVVGVVALGGVAGVASPSTAESVESYNTTETAGTVEIAESVESHNTTGSVRTAEAAGSGRPVGIEQNGTVDSITVDADFVGAVADGGTATVEASGVVDGNGDPVDGEQVTVTVGGEPVTTADVESGTLATTFEPEVLDLEPQDDAAVSLHGFDTGNSATVDVVHEVLDLDAGYNLHSVPQGADLVAQEVHALDVWEAQTGTYDAVTDAVFDTPDELNRALYIVAGSDDARLGYTFEADDAPVPGQETLYPGWNFVGSNFDISAGAEMTVQDDLVGVDAAAHGIFTADFGEQLAPDDTVEAYDGYWVFVDGESVERGTVAPTYDRASREDVLGVGASEFKITGIDIATSETDTGGLVEVTATVENQGDALDAQFVDLRADQSGEFDRVDRAGLELAAGDSGNVTLAHEVENTTQFDIEVATDDDALTGNVTWEESFFAVSALSAPGQADEGETITVNATVENTGFDEGTQDVLFKLDESGTFDAPAVQVVVKETLTLAPGANQSVELGVDAPAEAGELHHGIFTDDDSETAPVEVTASGTAGRPSAR